MKINIFILIDIYKWTIEIKNEPYSFVFFCVPGDLPIPSGIDGSPRSPWNLSSDLKNKSVPPRRKPGIDLYRGP